jgi:hypothetical protein
LLIQHIGNARTSFYKQAFRQNQPLDPDVHDIRLAPMPEGESAVLTAKVMGRDVPFDIIDMISDAEVALQSATLAGGGEYLDSWTMTRDRLNLRIGKTSSRRTASATSAKSSPRNDSRSRR